MVSFTPRAILMDVDGTLYYSTPYNRVFALDPETGGERWSFDPQVEIDRSIYVPPSRGVSSWRDDDAIDQEETG